MATLYLLLAAAVGAGTTVQSGVNSRLGAAVGPVWAAFVSIAASFAIALAMAAVRLGLRGLPAREQLSGLPWWAWVGGSFGAAFITVAVVVAPRVGATSLIAAVVAGQALSAVVVDQWGLVGFARREITPGRAVGMALVVAGVACVRRF